MARPQGTSARAQRVNATIATSLLAIATAVALARVFAGGGAVWRLGAAGVASGLLACAMERRNLLLATLVSAAGMLVAVGLWVFPDTTLHGLPTMHTLHAIGSASRHVGELARTQVAPTAPLRPLMLAALTSVWAAIFSAHALAFRAGSPLLALLPPVALVAFADTVMGESVRPLYGVAFLIAALALIFADGLRRVQDWGPVWVGPGKHARLSKTAGRSARRVAAISVALALMAPVLVPGFGSKAVIELGRSNGGHIQFDPLVSVASMLTLKRPQQVMQVQTRDPSYLRMLALTQFDGSHWRADPEPVTQPFGGGQLPGASIPPAVKDARVTIKGDLGLPGLPMPYPAVSVNGPAGDPLQFEPSSGTLTLSHGLGPDSRYDVEWGLPAITPALLRKVQFPTPAQISDDDTILPSNVPAEIGRLALDWTKDSSSTYDAILAIQDRLRSDYLYNTNVHFRDDSGALLDFLTKTKEGFCQQFASAMAVMLRTLGIPARVAVGFTQGVETSAGSGIWNITTQHAHSWVEVHFPAYGWLQFDPTPVVPANPATAVITGINVGPSSGCQGHPGCRPISSGSAGNGGSQQNDFSQTGKNATNEHSADARRGNAPTTGSGPAAPQDPWHRARPFVALGILLGLLGFALVPPIRALRRRVRLGRAAADPTRLVLTSYDVFTERAAELGFARGRGETVGEYRDRLVSSGARVNGHLDHLSSVVAGTAYAPRKPDAEAARTAAAAARSAWKDLRRGTPLVRRLTGAFRRP
jgi:hypothetical protein